MIKKFKKEFNLSNERRLEGGGLVMMNISKIVYTNNIELTLLQAKIIKHLRIVGCSWRKIAEIFNDLFPELNTGTGQIVGKELCDLSSEMLNWSDYE